MPDAPGPARSPTRARALFASALVVLTVASVWKFIDYRMQPPPPPSRAAAESH